MRKYIPVVEYKTFEDNIKRFNLECYKLDVVYHVSDCRYWTAVVNPKKENIFVTFHVNNTQIGDRFFDVLSSEKTISYVYVEDIYDTIDLIVNKDTINVNLEELTFHE